LEIHNLFPEGEKRRKMSERKMAKKLGKEERLLPYFRASSGFLKAEGQIKTGWFSPDNQGVFRGRQICDGAKIVQK
jgi:hypothetical protein